jgi:hypothetical protein
MKEQRTRFPSTSEFVYKVPADMSTIPYFFAEEGSSGKGGKRKRARRHAQQHEFDQIPIFSHRYLSYIISIDQ